MKCNAAKLLIDFKVVLLLVPNISFFVAKHSIYKGSARWYFSWMKQGNCIINKERQIVVEKVKHKLESVICNIYVSCAD